MRLELATSYTYRGQTYGPGSVVFEDARIGEHIARVISRESGAIRKPAPKNTPRSVKKVAEMLAAPAPDPKPEVTE